MLTADTNLKLKLIILIGLILLIVPIGISCASSPRTVLDSVLNIATKGYRFSIPGWEITSIAAEIKQTYEDRNVDVNDTQIVVDYIDALQQNNVAASETAGLRDKVESIIELQIRSVLKQNGIINPFGSIFKVNFPPIDFELAEPPHLLVISPRNQINRIRDILLFQNMTTDEMNDIENQVEESGYSALVVELGGLGAMYPTFVVKSRGLCEITFD